MSQAARQARRAGRVVLQIYREHAPRVTEVAAQLGVTCQEGCAHCCTLPATATVAEMVPVVEHLVGRPDWVRRRSSLERELSRQLAAFATVDVLDVESRARFFQRQLPCAFLTPDRRCEIYAVRPAVCRYHMVVSPPQNCAHGADNPTVARVDFRQIETTVAVRGAAELGELIGGPIALAFVIAAERLGVRLAIDRDLLDRVQIYKIDVRT